MVEISGTLRAVFPLGPAASSFAAAVNALRDESWRHVSSQLPRKGVVSAAALDTHATSVLAKHVSSFQTLFPQLSLGHSDVELLATCAASSTGERFELQCSSESAQHLREIAALLRRLGAPVVEGAVSTGSQVEQVTW